MLLLQAWALLGPKTLREPQGSVEPRLQTVRTGPVSAARQPSGTGNSQTGLKEVFANPARAGKRQTDVSQRPAISIRVLCPLRAVTSLS